MMAFGTVLVSRFNNVVWTAQFAKQLPLAAEQLPLVLFVEVASDYVAYCWSPGMNRGPAEILHDMLVSP